MVRRVAGIIQHDIQRRQIARGGGDVFALIHIAAGEGEAVMLEPAEIRHVQTIDFGLRKIRQPHPDRRQVCGGAVGVLPQFRATDLQAHFQKADGLVAEGLEQQVVQFGIAVLGRAFV